MAAITRRTVNDLLASSGLPASVCSAIDKLAARDPGLAMEQAKLAAEAQVQASAPRARRPATGSPRRPVAEIVAGAVAEGRIAASSAPYWTERLTSAPAATEQLLTASVEDGGLYAVGRIPTAPVISAAQEARDHERAFAASFPRQAAALGYEPSAASPFAVEPPPLVTRPGRTPVRHLRDGS
jgi:hypothetical protein